MKQPIHEQIKEREAKIIQGIRDITFLLKTLPENEAKPLIMELLEQMDKHSKKITQLVDRIKAQRGHDYLYINPKYKQVHNPENF